MKKITLLILLFVSYLSYGQEIASFSSANTECSGIVANDANLTANGICKNGVAPPFFGLTYSASDWPTAGLDSNKYFEWSITPNAGYEIDLANLQLGYATFFGPQTVEIHMDLGDGSGFNNIYTANPSDFVPEYPTIDLSAYTDLTNTITFRLYGYQASSSFGSLAMYNVGGFFSGKGIIINGSVDAASSCGGATVTWNGSWIGGTPDLTTPVILDQPYNTGTNGSFSACSLTINTGNTLTVTNGSFVEVENDIIVDGSLTIATAGSVVQNDDSAAFINNSNGVTLTKTKTMQNWFTYTYWSSPMSNETIENALGITPVDRRFRYEAVNFVDVLQEVGNTNTFIAGSDDIDDDGNDWVAASGTMTPGVGYATTGSQIVGPGGYPNAESYIFTGTLNNGIITVPVVDNSGGAYNDWNFIGNPYPSAISVDQFFTENAGIVDVVYLWDQATPPSATGSGNESSNFSNDDYAMINGTGEIGARAGTGVPPNRFVPTGQGFFVEALASGNVTFNNAMRVTSDNDQFFRIQEKKNSNNKLWLNMYSDNGAYNQVLVGYVDGATNGKDATYYDAPRNLSSGASAMLYSIIEGESKKFAIQGKDINSINQDEIVKIGFKTAIDVPTIYTLSIPKIEGDFLTNNPIVVRDRLLNRSHNLKDGDYNFTSEVGEFNDRFEILFTNAFLSDDEFVANDKALSIFEHNNGHFQFKLSGIHTMKNIQIIDLQGRILYNFEVNSNDVTRQLSALSQTPFIANITLDNNQTLTKKAMKR